MDWFLIKENEHLGPFDEETIRELFADGQCSEDDQVWKDGWADAKTFAEVFLEDDPSNSFRSLSEKLIPTGDVDEDEDLDEGPPPLPPLPVMNSKKTDEPPHAGEIKPTHMTEVPFEETSSVSNEEVESSISLDFGAEEFEIDQNEKRLLRIARNLAIALIVGILIFTGYFYFFKRGEIFERPKIMTLGDYERLSSVASTDPKKLDFAFALASDKRTLWASTNSPLEGEVFVNLKSKKGRVLGRDVEVKAKGYLKERLVIFSDFQFVQGTKFIDGFYDVEIYTVDDLKIPLLAGINFNPDRQFRFINEFLITSMNREDFNQQLERFASKRKMNSSEFWLEIAEKYRTVRSITEQIRAGFVKVLQTPSKNYQEAIKSFKDDYANRYGVFFTSFVRDNESSYERLVDKEFDERIEVMASYNELSNLSKKIGAESVSLLDEVEATNPSEKQQEQWDKFSREALIPFNLIIAECERKLALLKSRTEQ
ncbi:MAG: hypothetical protein CME62_02065 [Halobacteriovoraceae bacterium]|nr:hypothetical protein [Halobacteriovoraceae bacterium]|tara:strand:- start:6153 stop:7601 length:1449 start_codon:yes stop_codon:yes gene_type:complete